MDVFQVVEKLAAGGFVTFLVAILLAGKYRVWVWGYQLDEAVRDKEKQIEEQRHEKEQWRSQALGARDLTERSVTLSTKLAGKLFMAPDTQPRVDDRERRVGDPELRAIETWRRQTQARIQRLEAMVELRIRAAEEES